MNTEQQAPTNQTPAPNLSASVELLDSKVRNSSKLGERKAKKPIYFTEAYQVFRYNLHKENPKFYLRSYISRVLAFNEQKKVETLLACKFHTLQSSEDGDIYFLSSENYIMCVNCNNEESIVIPEKRDNFLLHEKDWDDKLRLSDGKLTFAPSHPNFITEAPSNHPNFFPFKKGLLVSWDRGFFYFYNLYTKIHSKPIPHNFDILGFALGKFESVFIADRRQHKIFAFNIFEQTKREVVDFPFSTPCQLNFEADELFIENAAPAQTAPEKNPLPSRQCRIFNTATQKSIGMEGLALQVSKTKSLCYFINKKGLLVVKNFRTGTVVEEFKLAFKPVDMIVSADERLVYFFAINTHPLSDYIKVVCWSLKKKKRLLEYDLNYAPANFFVNQTNSRILHFEPGARYATMEELALGHSETLRVFESTVDKVDLRQNAAYLFEHGGLFKLELGSNSKKLLLQKGDHIFRDKGRYYFVYSPTILAIFDKDDLCLFDDYPALNRRLQQIKEDEPGEAPDKKSALSDNEDEVREELPDKVRVRANTQNASDNQGPDGQNSSHNNNNNTDSLNERYDRLQAPQLVSGRKNIASLVRVKNPNMGREMMNRSFMGEAPDQNVSVMNFKDSSKPSELNWIYFLDFVDSDAPAFYFINYQNSQILIFDNPKLQSDPVTLFLEDRINDGRVTRDQIFFFALDMEGVIKQWNMRTSEKLKTFSVSGCYFELSANERRLYILNRDGQLYIVDIETDKVVAAILIDPKGVRDAYPSFSIQECENPNELLVHYSNKLKKHYLRPRVNVWEFQYISSFFKTNKTLKQDEFNSNIAKYRHVYKNSPLLKEYFNPIFIASLYSLSASLELIFAKNLYAYPFAESAQIKPLLLALYNRDLPILQSICEHLLVFKNALYLSFEETILLLHLDYPFTKAVLTKAIREVNTGDFDSNTYEWPETLPRKLVVVCQTSRVFNVNSLRAIKDAAGTFFRNMFQRISLAKTQTRRTLGTQQFDSNASNESLIAAPGKPGSSPGQEASSQMPLKSASRLRVKILRNPAKGIHQLFRTVAKKKVSYFMITARYNFHDGSQDSKYFLSHYSKSRQTNFVLSRFRLIIIDKWARLGYLFKIEAFVFLVLTISLTVYFFHARVVLFFYSSIVLLGVYLFYEGLSFYVDPKYYFRNPDNILDVIGFSFGMTVTVITYAFLEDPEYNAELLRLFQVITLMIYFYRLTTYMKAFETMSPIITMIYAVAYDIWDILVVFVISVFVFGILYLKANSGEFGGLLSKTYFSFYGQVPKELVDDDNFVKWIVLIGSTLFITLVMSNFIVARMNNNYSRMENRQIEVTLKEKARLLLEFETLLFILPSYRKSLRTLMGTKYYTLIAQDTSVLNNYEDFLQSKIESNEQDNEYLASLNQEVVQVVKRLDDRITKIELKNKEILQNLKQQKSS